MPRPKGRPRLTATPALQQEACLLLDADDLRQALDFDEKEFLQPSIQATLRRHRVGPGDAGKLPLSLGFQIAHDYGVPITAFVERAGAVFLDRPQRAVSEKEFLKLLSGALRGWLERQLTEEPLAEDLVAAAELAVDEQISEKPFLPGPAEIPRSTWNEAEQSSL